MIKIWLKLVQKKKQYIINKISRMAIIDNICNGNKSASGCAGSRHAAKFIKESCPFY